MGFHIGVNMEFMIDGHPYHFFRGIHRPSGYTWRCSWGRDQSLQLLRFKSNSYNHEQPQLHPQLEVGFLSQSIDIEILTAVYERLSGQIMLGRIA